MKGRYVLIIEAESYTCPFWAGSACQGQGCMMWLDSKEFRNRGSCGLLPENVMVRAPKRAR